MKKKKKIIMFGGLKLLTSYDAFLDQESYHCFMNIALPWADILRCKIVSCAISQREHVAAFEQAR